MGEPSRCFRTSDFEYHLPPELIAQTPAEPRGESRLLVVHRESRGVLDILESGTIPQATPAGFRSGTFSDLTALIPAGDLLVLNTTRVRRARLIGRRPSGAPAEVLLLHPAPGGGWIAMGSPGSALRPGRRVALGHDMAVETTAVLEDGYRVVRFIGGTADEAMSRYGRIPLPPYITHDPTAQDEERYQTVFAEREGSVAAPTAGLHFTTELLNALEAKGVSVARLDLEVGPGTFRPVETEAIEAHPMHPERYAIPEKLASQLEQARARGGRVWAVGTTVVRALESAALDAGRVQVGPAETRLMIVPGFRFRIVNRLITNFHLPRSTLLMLVAAFAGHQRTMAAYAAAVAMRYRFYSYGDAMLIYGER